jgi:hypothetical protein
VNEALQAFLLEVILLVLACVVGVALVAVGWFVGWLVWLVWRLFYLAWAGRDKESFDVDEWPDRPA